MPPFDLTRIKDFNYYAPNLLRIKTDKQQIIPFNFNSEQRRLHQVWEWQLKTLGMVRIIIDKARRVGMSTYVEGRTFHEVVTSPFTDAYIIAHDKDALNTIFNMSKLFWEELPDPFRPMLRYSNKKELVFENPNAKLRLIDPGLRSAIEVFSANRIQASRSGGYRIAHFSEVAFYSNAETLITSTTPSIPDTSGTVKVYESTANGRGNFFHNEWLKAKESLTSKRKSSNFYPIFFSWLDFADYKTNFRTVDEKEDFIFTMDEEEKELNIKSKATLEQLNWRRKKILDFGGDADKFHQEFPKDDIESFVASGQSYFKRQKLRELLDRCSPPKFVGEISALGFSENDDGNLWVWEKPQRGDEYIVSADVGGGVIGGDPSVIQVLKVPKTTPKIEQVAEWRDWIDPIHFAAKIVNLARWYNEALVVPETNNHGFATLNEIKQVYWHIYQWEYFDRFSKFVSNKIGWETNGSTKPIMCDYTSGCINADILIIHSSHLIDEMMSFIKNPTGSGEADANCYDDRVMAFMIGLFVVGHSYHAQSILKEMGLVSEPLSTEDEPRKVHRVSNLDRDLDNYFPDEEMVSSQDRSWMNY